jgi:DNA-directed RNA polymerase specialized sigma24 family protein
MRRRLVSYFDRKNCHAPDDLADETLNRVARRLGEEGAITGTSPARYCYIVARFVFLEYRRSPGPREVSLGDLREVPGATPLPASFEADEVDGREKRHRCLERCLEKLKEGDRTLIVEYYRGEQREKIEHRRNLAVRLGLTINALSIRTCRIRNKLEECVRNCCGRNDAFSEVRLKQEG